jgi:site-specific DNA recombinase
VEPLPFLRGDLLTGARGRAKVEAQPGLSRGRDVAQRIGPSPGHRPLDQYGARSDDDPIELLTRTTNEMPPDELDVIVRRSKEAAATLAGPRARAGQQLRDLIAGIRLGASQVSITLSSTALGALLDVGTINEAIELTVAGRLKRSGHVMRLIQGNGSSAAQVVDRTLVKAVVQGRSWWRELQSNTEMTIEDLARREGKTAAYIVRIVRLAFLSPKMLKSIIDGTLPPHLTVKRLCSPNAVPARWDRQFA